MEKNRLPIVNVGMTLIVLIFMNICLITFSVLSLQNSLEDYRLTKKTAEYTTAYYDAENTIEERWEQIDRLLEGISLTGETGKDIKTLQKAVKAGQEEAFFIEEQEDGIHISCAAAVGKHQELCAEGLVMQTEPGTWSFKEEKRTLAGNGTWQADRKVRVYQGQE